MALALAVLLASLLGSVHCAAMCGAFVCFYATDGASGSARGGAAGHAAYNAGRLISYLLLGTVAGALGSGVNRAGTLAGVQAGAALLSGVLMIGWGVGALLTARGVRVAAPPVPARWQHAMGTVLQRVRQRPPVVRAAITGLATTLLPCGWLYAFVVTAGGTGSVLRGAMVMLVFWVGTLPMMVAFGLGARRLFGPLRSRLPMISASAIVVLGVLSIAMHLGLLPAMPWLHHLLPAVPASDGGAMPITLHAH